jgi:hypothetical protein
MPFQSNNPDCVWSNRTEESARECMAKGAEYYDGCKEECIYDWYVVNLSQNLELEHFVYGKVRYRFNF